MATKRRLPVGEVRVYSIAEFCEVHRLSVSGYYLMRRRGEGPREMLIGRHRRISKEAAEEWRRKREAAR